MPRLVRINVFPIKSFDGVAVTTSRFVPGGGLQFDRRFALIDEAGNKLNGKKYPAIHRLRSTFSPDFSQVTLTAPDSAAATFPLAEGNAELDRYFSLYFGQTVRVAEDVETGFMDDPLSSGPTVVSLGTLRSVVKWFPPLELEEVRRRFRANLEVDDAPTANGAASGDCPPFWEDRLFAVDASPESQTTVPFRIGTVTLLGVNPCARCPVPTRDSRTGEAYEKFAVQFQQHRRDSLPLWAPASAFDHFYRLSVNTRPSPTTSSGVIRIGDEVEVLPR
jgi:uncharacterized protein